jgi:hypothetical protein
VVNSKDVHLDMVLDDVERVDQVWFKKSQKPGVQSGEDNIK